MKRSGFKQKPRKPLKRTPLRHGIKQMKRSPIKRKSKSDTAKLKDKLWELCKQIVRQKYRNKDGTWNCYTCGKIIDEPAKAQTGHFIPSAACGAFLRYDLRNLRIQDFHCNINLGGNGSAFYKRMVEEVGQEAVDQIFRDKENIVKADKYFYEEKIREYEQELSTD